MKVARKIAQKKSSKTAQKTKKAALSVKIKKILDKKKPAKLVLFEENLINPAVDKIFILKKKEKEIRINIVDHPLDVYSSPHVLDLSQSRFIERVRPQAEPATGWAYEELPGGEFLNKFLIFDLVSLEKSEILLWFRRLFQKVSNFGNRVDFSSKLPLIKGQDDYRPSAWQETVLVNFFSFIFSTIYKSFVFIVFGWRFIFNQIADLFRPDEVVEFYAKNQSTTPVFEKKYLPIKPAEPVVIYPQYSQPRNLIEKRQSITQNIVEKWKFFSQRLWPRSSILRPAAAFLVIAFVVVAPIKLFVYYQNVKEVKGEVLGQAEEALANLSSAQDALAKFDLKDSAQFLSAANSDFVSAQNQLGEIKSFLTVLAEVMPVSNTFMSGKNLLELGDNLSSAGEHLLNGIGNLSDQNQIDKISLTEKIKNFKKESELALADLAAAQKNLVKVNIKHLPEANRATFEKLQKNLPIFVASLEQSQKAVDFAIKFLGENELKRYLLVFQNDNELRPPGGFMGSFALVDLKSGDIKDIQLPGGGTYDVRAGFNELVKAPEPLQLINDRWEFQDANWWSSWPTSAQKITWFYNKSGGPTIDGVIAVNSDWMANLLSVVGPIDMPDYQKTITAANFEQEIQSSVEIEYNDKTQPKKILGDLAPKLLEKVFAVKPDKFLDLVKALSDGLAQKDILINLTDSEAQAFVAENNWDGRIKDSAKDYLSVVAANVGGGKTDNVIKQKIYHKATIQADGSIIDEVLISRYHFGPIDDYFTVVPNRSYLRVYAPQGSRLIKAVGFTQPKPGEFKKQEDFLKEDESLKAEDLAMIDPASQTRIYQENGKTVFGNWLTVAPGETVEAVLVYELPFKLNFQELAADQAGILSQIKATFFPDDPQDSYSLLVQKQPGSGDDQFFSETIYPENWQASLVYPAGVEKNSGELIFNSKLTGDLFYFSGFKK